MATKHKGTIEAAMKALSPELERIDKLPEVKSVLVKGSTLLKEADKLKLSPA